MSDRLLSVHDVSNLTGWSPFTIYRKSSSGEIPGRIKLGKSSLRFRESDIRDWLSRAEATSREGREQQ